MRKHLLLLMLAGLSVVGAVAQDSYSFEWHGFVNPHYYADSRAVVGGREDMMLFYPKPISRDAFGHDINSGWQVDMLAITARLGLRVKGPDMLGAKTLAYIEGDFTGATNATINNLRLRHAYIKLDWARHSLIAGQYWYAMVIHEIMPMTNPLNMGAPFHCYARQPQVRYTYRPLQGVEAIAVAQWQLDNMSQGILDGQTASSTQFARHSMVPELNAQLRYSTGNLMLGAAANLKTIQPIVPNPQGDLYSSFTWSLYALFTPGQWSIKAQTLLNNSLYEGCSLGGYMQLADGSFADWHFDTYWLDIERRQGHWRPGLFVGYASNRDYGNHTSARAIFGRGHDIASLWRIQPRLTYTTLKALFFTAEVEYTRAYYAEAVGNMRLSLSMVYAF